MFHNALMLVYRVRLIYQNLVDPQWEAVFAHKNFEADSKILRVNKCLEQCLPGQVLTRIFASPKETNILS